MKHLKPFNESSNELLSDIAKELSEKMNCDITGSCVHFAEEFVLKVHKINPNLLNDFSVIEGWVNWKHGDNLPQQHTWIELNNKTKIDPTFNQFTKWGWANYSTKKSHKYTGLDYYLETIKGTWFSERRKKYPQMFFKEFMNENQKYDDKVGKEFWFEYHCYESPESCDAELWYRSHQKIKVIEVSEWSHDDLQDRIEDATPRVYKIRFEDGFEGDALEDEIVDSPNKFYRPEPPKRR